MLYFIYIYIINNINGYIKIPQTYHGRHKIPWRATYGPRV